MEESGALPVIDRFEPLEDAVLYEISAFAVEYHDPNGRDLVVDAYADKGLIFARQPEDDPTEGSELKASSAGTCTGRLRIYNDLGLWAEATVELEVQPRPQDDDD